MDSATSTIDSAPAQTPVLSSNQRTGLNRTTKPSKACVPCKARKVKCNAALVGLPCGSCVSKECTERCVLTVRKRRKRAVAPIIQLPLSDSIQEVKLGPARTASPQAHCSVESEHSTQDVGATTTICEANSPPQHHILDPSVSEGPQQCRTDLHYLTILSDAMSDADTSSNLSDGPTLSISAATGAECNRATKPPLCYKPKQMDPVDLEFLSKKGAFDIPPKRCVDALLKIYFVYAYPYAPILDRVDFMQSYMQSNYSLFLMHAVLATATLYAPADILSECGFQDRSTAQESFYCKANMLYDFQYETGLLPILQGSVIMGTILLDRATDKDFQYWFHNSCRVAIKLGIHHINSREDSNRKITKIYKRIWWLLHFRDMLHSFVGSQNLRFLSKFSRIKPLNIDDWEMETIPDEFKLILSPISNREKNLFIETCELGRIGGQCLSIVEENDSKDPMQLMGLLDAWRSSLSKTMQVPNRSECNDTFNEVLLSLSFRFEAVLCRLVRRRWLHRDAAKTKWAATRLRQAIFELDAIIWRMLHSQRLEGLPMIFTTTIPVLLAFHIETALDNSETGIIYSASIISINQTMLVMRQLRDIPAIQRAIPVFEKIISIKKLDSMPGPIPIVHSDGHHLDDRPLEHGQLTAASFLQLESSFSQSFSGEQATWIEELLGLDFMESWQMGNMVLTDL